MNIKIYKEFFFLQDFGNFEFLWNWLSQISFFSAPRHFLQLECEPFFYSFSIFDFWIFVKIREKCRVIIGFRYIIAPKGFLWHERMKKSDDFDSSNSPIRLERMWNEIQSFSVVTSMLVTNLIWAFYPWHKTLDVLYLSDWCHLRTTSYELQ